MGWVLPAFSSLPVSCHCTIVLGYGAPNGLSRCLPEPVFTPHFLEIVVEVKALCHKTVVRVRKDILPVKYFCSYKSFFLSGEFPGNHETVTKLTWTRPPSVFWHATGLKTVGFCHSGQPCCLQHNVTACHFESSWWIGDLVVALGSSTVCRRWEKGGRKMKRNAWRTSAEQRSFSR